MLRRLMLLMLIAGTAYAQTPVPVSSGVVTIDASTGSAFKVLLNANVTSVKLKNPRPGQIVTILFTQNATGNYAVTFGGNITNTPTITGTGTTLAEFQYDSGSNTWYGLPTGGSSSSSTSSFSNLNSVLSYAPNTTIADGSSHPISGVASNSPFFGITTLAALAAVSINGTTPFSFLTTTPFNSAGVYNLTDSDVPNIDVAWLAIQAALLTGETKVPAGTYIIGASRILPLMLPLSNENSGNFTGTPMMLQGDGQQVTIIKAGQDFGTGVPLIACGDPNGTFANSLGRYSGANGQCNGDVQDITFRSSYSSALFAVGTTPINMTGFAWGARLRTKDVNIEGFSKDLDLIGDHTLFVRLHTFGGAYGVYWNQAQSVLLGDVTFIDLFDSGQSIASIAVNGNASISGADFNGETYLSAPYAVLGETGACSDIMTGVRFDQLMMEYIGNAFIADDNGFSAGTYTDTNKCRNLNGVIIDKLFTVYDNSKLWTATGRGRRASFDVNSINIDIEHLQMQGGTFAPVGQSAGPSGIATFNVNHTNSTGIGSSRIAGVINKWITNSGTLPLVAIPSGTVNFDTSIKLEEIGQWKGEIVSWPNAHGNYTTTSTGDCFEWQGFTITPCGSNAETVNGIAGIAMQAGLVVNNMVPLAESGYTNVNGGQGSSFTTGFWKKGTGIGSPITITAGGTGGTNGTFTGVATTGGGCLTEPTFSFTVAGGIITSTTITTQGVGCTSAPTLPTSASSGLSGATLTAKWPGALITPASVTDTGALVGNNVGGGGGSWGIALQLSGQAPFPGAVAFSTLPACSSAIEGTSRAVKDSSTATWGATVTGSSTNHVLAYCDGTNWTVAAQ